MLKCAGHCYVLLASTSEALFHGHADPVTRLDSRLGLRTQNCRGSLNPLIVSSDLEEQHQPRMLTNKIRVGAHQTKGRRGMIVDHRCRFRTMDVPGRYETTRSTGSRHLFSTKTPKKDTYGYLILHMAEPSKTKARLW